jgi:hypothetical protein
VTGFCENEQWPRRRRAVGGVDEQHTHASLPPSQKHVPFVAVVVSGGHPPPPQPRLLLLHPAVFVPYQDQAKHSPPLFVGPLSQESRKEHLHLVRDEGGRFGRSR